MSLVDLDSAEDSLISLEDGWSTIYEGGIKQYVDRIKSGVQSADFERKMIGSEVFVRIYDLVFRMCVQKDPENWSEPLYERYCSVIRDFLLEHAIPRLEEARAKNELAFLSEWVEQWMRQERVVRGLQRMFMYLDRFYVVNTEEAMPLTQKGFDIFRETVYSLFKEQVRQTIFGAVIKERQGEAQDRDLLEKSVKVFVDEGFKISRQTELYSKDFELPYVEETKKFYGSESRIWMDQDSCPEYLIKAEVALEEEMSRLQAYLHHSSIEPVMKACREEILKKNQAELLNKKSGIGTMLHNQEFEDLSRLYRLYAQVEGGKEPIADAFREHVKTLGFTLIDESRSKSKDSSKLKQEDTDEHELIRKIIELHDRFRGCVKNCFQKDQIFEKALKEAFEDLINKENYTSNLLAKFINAVLEKGSKFQVQDLENTLDHVVMIYGYIRQKDIFEEKYHSFLANRLLTRKSSSQQAEKTMIAKLKNEAGYQWTSKLETMFKDVQRSQELSDSFDGTFGKSFEEELSVIVCTSGSWPSSTVPSTNAPPVTIAPEVAPLCEKFKEFYLQKFAGTKLSWALNQGEAELMVNFAPNYSRTLVLSTYQMLIMLLFNHQRILKFSDIREKTQIPKADLIAHILSLAHPKVKILLKKPNVKDVTDSDEFMINSKFVSKAFRVVVKLLNLGSTTSNASEGVSQQIMIQRRHQIDASIVRVMKTRQRIDHNNLVVEVMKQLQRFKPDTSDIKKRIEAMIEQEYLERDESDRKIYNYIA